jgi:paraquat-inducible protein A
MVAADLIACHECDLLHRQAPLPQGGKALCTRCGATLYRSHPRGNERALALALGGIVLFAIANSFPIITLELGGERVEGTLLGAVRQLWSAEMRLLSAMVFATMFLMPLVQLVAICWLLVPLRMGRAAPELSLAFSALQAARTWGMVEVFVLGVLVTLAKLAHLAHATPDIALWAFGALMLVAVAAENSFDARELWSRG